MNLNDDASQMRRVASLDPDTIILPSLEESQTKTLNITHHPRTYIACVPFQSIQTVSTFNIPYFQCIIPWSWDDFGSIAGKTTSENLNNNGLTFTSSTVYVRPSNLWTNGILFIFNKSELYCIFFHAILSACAAKCCAFLFYNCKLSRVLISTQINTDYKSDDETWKDTPCMTRETTMRTTIFVFPLYCGEFNPLLNMLQMIAVIAVGGKLMALTHVTIKSCCSFASMFNVQVCALQPQHSIHSFFILLGERF